MVISLAAGLFVLALVLTVGIPAAVRLSRPHVWRRGRGSEATTRVDPESFPPSFEPLDLGPDPVRWPSETPWPLTARPELPWPSQTWDDPHFGVHWRTHTDGSDADRAYVEAQTQRREQSAAARRAEGQRRSQRAAAHERAQDEVRELKERATAATQQVRQALGNPAQEVQRQGEQAARQAARRAAERARKAAATKLERAAPGAGKAIAKLPSNAELEALVAQVGLAGTVQEIMKRTGWDFKTAAQHLARARRGR